MDKPKIDPNFYIKAKDPTTGKYRIVGAAWKKEGTYGPYISLSIGDGDNRKSYLMDEVRKKGGELPKPVAPSSPIPEIDSDEIPF